MPPHPHRAARIAQQSRPTARRPEADAGAALPHGSLAAGQAVRRWLNPSESTLMANPDRAIAALHEFRAMGIRLSLDDFGTGYSSMAYLKILPVDQLKVDRSFVRDLNSNDSDAVLVQSSIDLGHNLGLSVVAEGVEDDATLIVLKTLGADVIQGFYLGRPMPEALLQTMDARAQPRTGTDKRNPAARQ